MLKEKLTCVQDENKCSNNSSPACQYPSIPEFFARNKVVFVCLFFLLLRWFLILNSYMYTGSRRKKLEEE